MAKLGEKVAILGIKREPGYMYYLDKEGDVSRSPMWGYKKLVDEKIEERKGEPNEPQQTS